MCLKSGYKTLTPIELANCLQAHRAKKISSRGVRVFFGCLAMLAIREASFRVAKRKGQKPWSTPRFLQTELCALTGLSEGAVKRELKALAQASVLAFSETGISVNKELLPDAYGLCQMLSGKRSPKRPIPFPRSVLRFLARSTKHSLSTTIIAYVVRGLSLSQKSGEVSSAGTVKASWVSKAFGLSLRSAKGSRKELIHSGFISKDTGSFQRKLNRDGAYFRISLDWSEKLLLPKSKGGTPPKFAPRRAATHPKIAPPYKDRKTSNESKNQKTQLSGVCVANGFRKPSLSDVTLDDLKYFPRLKRLFFEAVQRGWVKDSESDFLNWVAAAVRAKEVGCASPVKVFLGITKGQKWHFITQAQEDRARGAIRLSRENSFRNGAQSMFQRPKE